MIILYYVYLDTAGKWYAGPNRELTTDWVCAKEFTSREAAKAMAEILDGVVFGWVQ